jgi:cyanophycin synthetase
MQILKIQVLRGPNLWSNYRKKLIQMRLDIGGYEQLPTNKIPGFKDRLQTILPSLYYHRCSERNHGGFFHRIEEGTWIGHVIEHIALEIQTLAGMDTGYGRTRSVKESGVYNVVFSYLDEEAGIYAAKAAVRIALAVAENTDYNLDEDILELKRICAKNCLGPSTKSIVDEAVKRSIPYFRLGTDSMIQLGYGANQMRFQATMTCKTSILAANIASDKHRTKELLEGAAIPVPMGGTCTDLESLKPIVEKIGFPIVLKPLNGNHGRGVTTNVTNWEEAITALETAQQHSYKVVAEQFITGFDYRVLVIDNKFVAASKRVPAHITGNGIDSIKTLVDITNMDTRRGNGHENVLTKITTGADSDALLLKQGYNMDSIPADGEVVYLKSTANLSTGGSSVDVTDRMHPDNIIIAERIAKVIGLDICGIDIVASTLEKPLKDIRGAVIEVNAAPGFRMHFAPSEGTPRNVAKPVVDMLFPEGSQPRIPIIAITGTNGKTTTTRLMAHIAQNSGYTTGFTTTDGIYVNNRLAKSGDTTGPNSAEFILKDPTVDFAVLETARGGILRSGLAFDNCDVAIITNIEEDHLGLSDIHNLDDLCKVKAVVARSVKRSGWAILNAENKYCNRIARELDCNVAFFSLDPENKEVRSYYEKGHTVAVLEDGYLTIKKNGTSQQIAHVGNVPLTENGNIKFMVANALSATLAAYAYGFSVEEINSGLESFTPGYELTPGRMNRFEAGNFNVLVDYAHNPHGYTAMEDYLASQVANKKIGIISGIGDRRDQDIKLCAQIAARMFDHVIIRQEQSLRGNTEQHIVEMILEGLAERNIPYDVISEEELAVKHALEMAADGDLVVALTEKIDKVVGIINNYKAKTTAVIHV